MEASTLTLGARALQLHIRDHTDIIATTDVHIGHPAQVTDSSSHGVSVFFFKIFAAGNSGDIVPQSPLEVTVHCLITPHGKQEDAPTPPDPNSPVTSDVSSGESDLSILGQVMQCMHEHPLLKIQNEAMEKICEIEITPLELSSDDLNKIVPTPPKDGYRPSVAYALVLLPVPLGKPPVEGPMVRVLTYGLSTETTRADPDLPGELLSGLSAKALGKTTGTDPWVPQLYLLGNHNSPTYFRRIVTREDEIRVDLLVVGPPGKKIQVIAERWVPRELGYEFVQMQEVDTHLPHLDDLDEAFRTPTQWLLNARVPGQYLFRVQRELDPEACDLRLMVASDGHTEKEIIQEFRTEFEAKKKQCAVLMVRAASDSDRWTTSGFSDTGDFVTVVIDDPSHELARELKSDPIDESRIVRLATSSLGRTLTIAGNVCVVVVARAEAS